MNRPKNAPAVQISMQGGKVIRVYGHKERKGGKAEVTMVVPIKWRNNTAKTNTNCKIRVCFRSDKLFKPAESVINVGPGETARDWTMRRIVVTLNAKPLRGLDNEGIAGLLASERMQIIRA